MKPDKILVQVRLNRELVKQIDHRAIDWGVYRPEAMEKILTLGLEALHEKGTTESTV